MKNYKKNEKSQTIRSIKEDFDYYLDDSNPLTNKVSEEVSKDLDPDWTRLQISLCRQYGDQRFVLGLKIGIFGLDSLCLVTGLSWDILGHDSTKALCPTKLFKEVDDYRERFGNQSRDQLGLSARRVGRDNPKLSWDNMGRNFQEFFCPVLQKKDSYTTMLFKGVDDYRERLRKQYCDQPAISTYPDESQLESLCPLPRDIYLQETVGRKKKVYPNNKKPPVLVAR